MIVPQPVAAVRLNELLGAMPQPLLARKNEKAHEREQASLEQQFEE